MAVCLSSLVSYRCACRYGLWAQVVAEPIDDIVYDGLLEPMVVAMVCLVEHDILHLRPILAEGLVEMVALSLRHHVVVVAVHDEERGKSGMDVAQRTGGTRLVGYLLQKVARIAAMVQQACTSELSFRYCPWSKRGSFIVVAIIDDR